MISDIASTEPSETLHPEDSLRQRIAYVERKAALANLDNSLTYENGKLNMK